MPAVLNSCCFSPSTPVVSLTIVNQLPKQLSNLSLIPPSSTARLLTVASSQVQRQAQMAIPKKPSALRAIFFDLDGTCVNSDHIHFETYRDTLLELVPKFNNGEAITRELYDSQMSGRQNPELVATILPDMPLEERTNIWQTKESRYEDIIMKGVPSINGLIILLKKCKEYNMDHFIVTNAPKGSCMKTLKSIGIKSYFNDDHIVVAEECQFPKPHPAPYLKALELAGVPSHQAIVFEDSPSGTKAAIGAGIFTVGMRSTQLDATLRNAGASFTIQDYEDPVLSNFLKEYNVQ